MHFEWDPRKERLNRRKHGVSFEEAQTVFLDEWGVLIDDPDHSNGEERFILIGMSAALRVLIVCHSYRASDAVIRIISSRRAEAHERREYRQRWLR